MADRLLLGEELGVGENGGGVEVDVEEAAEGVGAARLDDVRGESFVMGEEGDVARLGADVGGDEDRARRGG